MTAPNVYDVEDLAQLDLRLTDAGGTATDADEITLKILTPADTETVYVFGVGGTISNPEVGYYTAQIPLTEVGTWSYRWETVDPRDADEGLLVVRESAFAPSAPHILTPREYKIMRQIDEDDDRALEIAASSADDAILDYTDRDLLTEPASGTRTYVYDGSGVLDIDDCATITQVTLNGTALTLDDQFIPAPQNSRYGIYWYLDIIAAPGHESLEMGFTRNLDTFPWNARRPLQVTVTASFGWPQDQIPGAAKQAAAWLIDEFVEQSSVGKQAESIADLSVVYAAAQAATSSSLPPRITELLDPLRRPPSV